MFVQYRVLVADCWPLCSLLCQSVDVPVLLSAFCRAFGVLHRWSLPPLLMGCLCSVVVGRPLLVSASSRLRTCEISGQETWPSQFKSRLFSDSYSYCSSSLSPAVIWCIFGASLKMPLTSRR